MLASIAKLRKDGRAEFQRGVKLAEQGDCRAPSLRRGRACDEPSLAQAHANLITLYGRTGDMAKAEEHYRAVGRARSKSR